MIDKKLYELVSDHLLRASDSDIDAIEFHDDLRSFSLTGQELYKVFKCVREKLTEHDIRQEVVIIHLDLNTFDIVYYVPVIFAIISTGNVFYFLSNQKDLKQDAEALGSRVYVSKKMHNCDVHEIDVEILQENKHLVSSLPSDTVYVIKTSGSTGEAKTIYVTNASIVPNIINMVTHLQLTPDDRVLMSSPPTFVPHMIDIFVTFMSDAKLVIIPRHRLLSQTSININNVTVLHCTPSLLVRLSWPISSLRILAIGGEKCSEESKRRLMTAWRSGVMVFHMYGLTEMSVWQSMTRMTSEQMIMEMPILVKHQNLLSDTTLETDEAGEIIIESSQRHCFYKENGREGIKSHPLFKSGDLGEWSKHHDEDWLIWKGRQDDVVKIFEKFV